MNLRQLQLFVTVAEQKSMTEAANQLYMTQPAVSQTIADLETELGVKLFDRVRRSLLLTEPGHIFFAYSKKMLLLLEEAKGAMNDFKQMKTGKLHIGTSTTVGIYLLPEIISSFKSKHTDVDISFMINNTKVIEDHIVNHQIDIGIVEGITESNDLVVVPYMEDELVLVCSSDHHWVKAGVKSIQIEQIQAEPIVFREEGSGTRNVIERLFLQHQLTVSPSHVLNNTEAIKRIVAANIGVAFLSKAAVRDELNSGKLVEIIIEGVTVSRHFNIIFHKDKYKSPLFDVFLGHLIQS